VLSLTADFNGDLQVDAADLAIWQTNLGPSALGDADDDGDTDGNDLLHWQQQLGLTVSHATSVKQAASIPEPGGLALLALALGALSVATTERLFITPRSAD
jgi:hypothetical protein